MINKTFKRIHNKYSSLLNFLFFLRYLFGFFFISLVLFLSIPYFFDFKKKDEVIKDYLLESYDLKVNNYANIKYNFLPTPNLEIQNIDANIGASSIQINVVSLIIYPKLLSIYNYEDFRTRKIVLIKNKIQIFDSDLKILTKYFFNLKNRLSFKNLDIKIKRNSSTLIDLKKISFSNHGYNSNIIKGEVIGKNFKVSLNDNYHKINFKLLKTGIIADINFDKIKNESFTSGNFKSKFLNSNFKFDFNYNDKKFKIYNSYFRNKNLSFNNKSVITYRPYFSINSIFNVDDFNTKLLINKNINRILNSKNLIKKINIKNEINFKSKKFSNNLIDNLNLNLNLAYGRLVFSKKIEFSENILLCLGNINLLEEYPILYFDCSIDSSDKKKFLKEFSIKYKNKNELFKLNVKGNINILNNKINFKNITMNKEYKASQEDLNNFKQSFENILFNQDFLGIFNYEKMKEFILEIS